MKGGSDDYSPSPLSYDTRKEASRTIRGAGTIGKAKRNIDVALFN